MPNSVLATRFNNLQSRIATVLGTSLSTNPQFGYGQSYSSSSVIGNYDLNTSNTDLISSAEYETLYRDIVRARVHQIGNSFTQLNTPEGDFENNPNADKIEEAYIAYLEGVMNDIETDKFEIDSTQFVVAPLDDANGNRIDVVRPESQGSWNGILSHIFKVSFNNAAHRRHFFNAGGQIRMSAEITWAFSQAKTNAWKNMLNDIGSVKFSAKGTDSSNGNGIPSSIGNYDLTSSYQLVYRIQAATYSGSYYEVYALELSDREIQFRIYFKDSTVENIDENVFGELSSYISFANPQGTVTIGGTQYTTATITDEPIGQNIAVFSGVALPNPPTISAYFSPSNVTVGTTQTLIWNTTNTTSVSYTITDPGGTQVVKTGQTANGSRTINWTTTGTGAVTITAIGPGGSDTVNLSTTVTAPAVVPTYLISPIGGTSQNEGTSKTFTITTTNVNSGTLLYWGTAGSNVTPSDFNDSSLQGSVSVNSSGQASIVRTTSSDVATEGLEQYQIVVYTDSARTNEVARSPTVSINDTSTSPEIWSISGVSSRPGQPTVISEGAYTATFTVSTSNVPNGTVAYWTTEGGVTANDFTDNSTTGIVTIQNGSATFTRSARADQTTEGAEAFRIRLWSAGYNSGTNLANSGYIGIADLSRDPPILNSRFDTFSMPSSVQEGTTVTVSWTTTYAGSVTLSITYPNGTSDNFAGLAADGSRSISTIGKGTGTLSVSATAFNNQNGSNASTSDTTTVAATPPAPSGTAYWSPTQAYPNDPSAKSSYPDSATLYWNFSDATSSSFYITEPNGNIIGPGPGSVSGSYVYTPSIAGPVTTVVSASGFGGSTSSTPSLTILAPLALPSVTTFTVTPSDPTIVYAGSTVTLSWTTSNADYATVSGIGFTGDEQVSANGSREVTVTAEGTESWVLVAHNDRSADAAQVNKVITRQPYTNVYNQLPSTLSFDAAAGQSAQFAQFWSGRPGTVVNWSWTYDRGPYTGGGTFTIPASGQVSNSGVHTDYGTFTYVSTFNDDSPTTITRTQVIEPPTSWSLTASPTTAAAGENITFTVNGPANTSWTASYGQSGTTNSSGVSTFTASTYPQPTQDNTAATYTVTLLDSNNTIRDTATVTVYYPVYIMVNPSLNTNSQYIDTGDNLVINYEVGGNGPINNGYVRIIDPNGTVKVTRSISSNDVPHSAYDTPVTTVATTSGTYNVEGYILGPYNSDSSSMTVTARTTYSPRAAISPTRVAINENFQHAVVDGPPNTGFTATVYGTLYPSGTTWSGSGQTFTYTTNSLGSWTMSGVHTGEIDYYFTIEFSTGETATSNTVQVRAAASGQINFDANSYQEGDTVRADWTTSNTTTTVTALLYKGSTAVGSPIASSNATSGGITADTAIWGNGSYYAVLVHGTDTLDSDSVTVTTVPFTTSVTTSNETVEVDYGDSWSNGYTFTKSVTVRAQTGSGTVTMSTSGSSVVDMQIFPSSFNLSAGQTRTVTLAGQAPSGSLTNPWTFTLSSNKGGSYTRTVTRTYTCQNPPNTSDSIATYNAGMVAVFADGSMYTNIELVASTKNADVAALNNYYQSKLGRPGDRGGLNYWYNRYLAAGAATALAEFDAAAESELARGSVTIYTYCEYQAL
jgi:hypothetical protein